MRSSIVVVMALMLAGALAVTLADEDTVEVVTTHAEQFQDQDDLDDELVDDEEDLLDDEEEDQEEDLDEDEDDQEELLDEEGENESEEAEMLESAGGPPIPAAPALSGSFHTKYSIFLFNMLKPLLPMVSNFIDKASKLMDGECWQNTNPDGTVTIKTITTPSTVGSILTKAMTQTWVKTKGWTEKAGQCTKDAANTQLVIPGDILTKTGKFRATRQLTPILPVVGGPQAAAKDGSYTVDEWDASLGAEGTVTYYIYHGTTTPLMSHYMLKGKPPVWAQYIGFTAGANPDAVYTPSAACAAAAA